MVIEFIVHLFRSISCQFLVQYSRTKHIFNLTEKVSVCLRPKRKSKFNHIRFIHLIRHEIHSNLKVSSQLIPNLRPFHDKLTFLEHSLYLNLFLICFYFDLLVAIYSTGWK